MCVCVWDLEVLNIILEWWHDVALGLQWSWCQEVSPYMHACMRDEAFYDINSCMRPRAGKGVTYSSGENKIVKRCLLSQQNMNLWIDHSPFFWLLFLYYIFQDSKYRTGTGYIDIETSTFCTSLNIGRTSHTGQFWAISTGTGCTGQYRKKFFLYFLYFLSFVIFEFLLGQNGNLFALTY